MSRLAHRGLRKASVSASFRRHREADPGSRTRKTKIMGRKEEKKERCEGREGGRMGGWMGGGRGRKVKLEKRRRVNGGGLRAPGSWAMEPRRFIGVARDGERGRGKGKLVWCTFFVRYFTENGRSPPLPLVAQKRV